MKENGFPTENKMDAIRENMIASFKCTIKANTQII